MPDDDTAKAAEKDTSARLTGGIRVGVAINVLSVSNVDTVGQSFRCEFVLRCRTLNIAADKVRVVGTGAEVTPDNWEPRVRFLNLLETITWGYHAKKKSDGEIEMKFSVMGVFRTSFNLERFPFDTQELRLEMSSSTPAYTGGELGGAKRHVLSFCEMPTLGGKVSSPRPGDNASWAIKRKTSTARATQSYAVQLKNFSAAKAFTLRPHVFFRESETSKADSTTGTIRPRLTLGLEAGRRPFFYAMNVMVPVMLINVLTAGAFAIPYEDLADRLSVSVTMVLTSVAFKLHLATLLPALSYLTALDYFVIVSFVFGVLVALENIVAQKFWTKEQDALAATAFLGALAAGTVALVAWNVRGLRRLKRFQSVGHSAVSGKVHVK